MKVEGQSQPGMAGDILASVTLKRAPRELI